MDLIRCIPALLGGGDTCLRGRTVSFQLHESRSGSLMLFQHSVFFDWLHLPNCSCVRLQCCMNRFSAIKQHVRLVRIPSIHSCGTCLTSRESSRLVASSKSRDIRFRPIPPAIISSSLGGTEFSVNACDMFVVILCPQQLMQSRERKVVDLTMPLLLKPNAQLGSSPA